MAAPLMQGFTMDDYVLADKLGYTREQFEGMGQTEMRNMLSKKTPQKSYVQPTSVINQQGVYNTPSGEKGKNTPMVWNEDTQSMIPKSEPVNLVGQETVIPVEDIGLESFDTTGDITKKDAPIPTDYSKIYDNGKLDQDAYLGLDSEGRKGVTDLVTTENAISEMNRANSFDWMGAANVGLQGINTAMEVGMYGDKKDYMGNVNKGLEQNMKNAQATHDNRATQQQNLGSTFSRNA